MDATNTGMTPKDFSHLDKEARIAQGRDIGEKFIIQKLAEHGIVIEAANDFHVDARLKIDGFLNGDRNEPVQIKLRRTGRDSGDDVAYEVCLGHNDNMSLVEQIEDPKRQGRDWKGGLVKHYFVLDRTETKIYSIPATKLRSMIIEAMVELEVARIGGRLVKPFKAGNGVDLRPTRDPHSGTKKVMAFIPAKAAATTTLNV